MTLPPRIYVAADPDATIRAIANTAEHSYSPRRDELCISFDGKTYYTVLFNKVQNGPGHYEGSITQPALDVDGHKISFANGEMTCENYTYVLDETAVIGEIITKPVMRVVSVVETYAGYYVIAQNYLTGRSHHYLNGQPLTIVDEIHARDGNNDLVADYQYEGHRWLVRGDHKDVTRQTATFDEQPATRLIVQDYVVTFADDLSNVTVEKK